MLAAVGAADLALATVNEILGTLRERAELAGDRMDDRRAALTRLQEELPKRREELREKLSTEELRKAADEFFADATQTYNSLVERGEAALERLKGQPEFREAAERVETYVDQAVELTQEALGNVGADPRGRQSAPPSWSALSCRPRPSPPEGPGQKAAPARRRAGQEGRSGQGREEGRRQKAPAKKAPAKKVTQK